MTWIRTHFALAVTSFVLAVSLCAVGFLYSSVGERRQTAQQPIPTPTISLSAPVSDYQLIPALDTTNPLENTEAVRTIRETYAASAWANLTNSNDFAQYRLYVARFNSPVAAGGAPESA